MFPALYLVRHGHTKLNRSGDSSDRIRGWIDVPLDKSGIEEAHQLADKLTKIVEHVDTAVLYSSDLQRASKTADIIGRQLGKSVMKTYALRPWNLGDFQGNDSEEAAKAMPSFVKDTPNAAVPRGESFNSFKRRYLQELKKLLRDIEVHGRSIIAVAHYRNEKMAEAWIKAQRTDNADVSALDLDFFLAKTPDHTGSGLEIYRGTDGKWTFKRL